MKKEFLIFAAGAIIVASCNNNEVVDSIGQNEGKLVFNTAIGKQIRTSELMNDGLQAANSENNGIAVYAYQETGTVGTYKVWFEDNLWYASGSWKIASTRFRNTAATKYLTYYPKTHVTPVEGSAPNKTTFEEATFASSSVLPAFTYTIQSEANQEDLVAGITDVAANKTDIVVAMRHILSQVNFGVKGYKGAQIEISEIQIHDVFNSAKYTYGAVNNYTLGVWSDFGTGTTPNAATAFYNYAKKGGAVPANTADVETVKTGDIYIFGDGGNFGPGKAATTWYPTTDGKDWIAGTAVGSDQKMNNSLMLMPQDFRATSGFANKNAYVTFKYTIKDVSDAFVANNASGRFQLDFSFSNASAYASQWKQNLRYVYIIDFTDFLNDNKLTFKVDVQTYPWENYDSGNNPSTGIVNVPVIGQPTESVVNTITNGAVLFAATRTTTPPTSNVQVLTNEVWHWEVYAFEGISTQGDSFNLNFSNVIFNGKSIDISVGAGYTIYIGTEATQQQVRVTDAATLVTIKKL